MTGKKYGKRETNEIFNDWLDHAVEWAEERYPEVKATRDEFIKIFDEGFTVEIEVMVERIESWREDGVD